MHLLSNEMCYINVHKFVAILLSALSFCLLPLLLLQRDCLLVVAPAARHQPCR